MTDFILHIKAKGFLTRKNQKIFSGLGYYLATWRLRDDKIIYVDGLTGDRSNEKIWKLTEKGKVLADLLEKQENLGKRIDEELRK